MKFRIRKGIAALSFFVLYFYSCKTEEIIVHGDITGYVTDAENNNPLSKVTLYTFPSGDTAMTANDGKYFFNNLPPGKYEIQASKQGYSDSKERVVVVSANTILKNIQLTSTPHLKISETQLDFGFDKTELSFHINNPTIKNLTFVFVPSQKWISVNPAYGELINDSVKVTVSINRSILPEKSLIETIKLTSLFPEGSADTLIILNLNFLKDVEGKSYKTVRIGEQIWMAENLNTGIIIGSYNEQSDNGFIEKYCGDNSADNCRLYGGSYTWNEMMQYKLSDNNSFELNQGICPIGWHIPSRSEYETLMNYLGGNELAGVKLVNTDVSNWRPDFQRGTNESGFSGIFPDIYNPVDWWTSSENPEAEESAFTFVIQTPYNTSGFRCDFFVNGNAEGHKVRCMKNQ